MAEKVIMTGDPHASEKPSRSAFDAAPGLLGILADFFGLAIIAPILPEWIASKNASTQWVGYIISGQYAAVVMGSAIFGALADRYGNVCALSSCMLVDAALFAASGWAPSPASLLAMRLVAGVATPQALAISWISSVSPPDLLPRRMGLVAACIHLGILSGTIAAGFVNWEVACVMSAVLPVLNLLLLITWHGRSDASTGLDKPALTSKSRSAALASGIKTIHFASVASTMFANGFEMSIHFALLVVVLTKDYGLTRAQYSLSLAPASFVQIFNHYYLLPRLIQVAPAYDLLTSLSACLVIILLAALLLNVAIPSSPWPFLVVQNVALWAMSFTQGVGNFASATHAASIAPEAKAALIGLGRSTFNLGAAVGPAVLVAAYLAVNVRVAFALLIILYLFGAITSYLAAQAEKRETGQSRCEREADFESKNADNDESRFGRLTSDAA